LRERLADIRGMSAGVHDSAFTGGEGLLMTHCDERLPVADRLERLIGPDLRRLLVVALAGDHPMR
jgi:hypothetical protein